MTPAPALDITTSLPGHFPLAKTFASPHAPGALFAHTISVSDALSHFVAKDKHIFLVMMTRLSCMLQSMHKTFVPSGGPLSFYLIHD